MDLIGQRFGRLLVLKRSGSENGNSIWACKCDCDNEKIVLGYSLKSGNTRSCGCFKKEFASEYPKKHNMSNTSEYISWTHMLARCRNKNNHAYSRYGGRGIEVCEGWLKSFESFYKDMGAKPSGEYSLERMNNNGNYESSNCRWATYTEQANNTRASVYVSFKDERLTVTQWERKLKINKGTLWNRLFVLKWSIDKAILTPVISKRKLII